AAGTTSQEDRALVLHATAREDRRARPRSRGSVVDRQGRRAHKAALRLRSPSGGLGLVTASHRAETCQAACLWGSVTAQYLSFLVANNTGPAPGAPTPRSG